MTRTYRQVGNLPGWSPWWRCDLCRWSGPAGRFVVLWKPPDMTEICDHSWCWGNKFVREQLLADGWRTADGSC